MKQIAIGLVSGILVSILLFTLYQHYQVPSFGVVRVPDLIEEHVKDMAKGGVIGDDQAIQAEAYSKILELTMDKISEDNNLVLFVSPAVITKLPDYTDTVRATIKDAMSRI